MLVKAFVRVQIGAFIVDASVWSCHTSQGG
jgi:hypothetical protein